MFVTEFHRYEYHRRSKCSPTKHVADHHHQAPHPESTSKFTFVYRCCFGRLKIIMSGSLHGSSMYDYLLLLQTYETVLTYIILHYSQVLLCVCINILTIY